MPERLVDVKIDERLLHTFPVTVSDQAAKSGEDSFKAKALQAAANAKVVRNEDLQSLSADMHVSRGGALEPSPDALGVLAETGAGLEQVVRERAFKLWEMAGRPERKSNDFWYQAQYQHWSERAYALWEREGRPEGKTEEYWFRTVNFERD